MGASENFDSPDWQNPVDTDLDAMRDSLNFLLLLAARPNIIIPGWDTAVTPSANGYGEPSEILLTKGTRQIKFTNVWTDGNLTTVTICYHDGVSGWSCFDPFTIVYNANGCMTAAWQVEPDPPFVASYEIFQIEPETGSWAIAQFDGYPASPGNGGFDFGYTSGIEPSSQWYLYHEFTDTEHTGLEQFWIKAEVVEVISGRETAVFTEGGGNLEEWNDQWDDWILELQHKVRNGVPEEQNILISIAADDGAGAPDLTTVTEYPCHFFAYGGKEDYILDDTFTRTNGDLDGDVPAVDRRDDGAGDGAATWRDLYYEETDYEHDYFSINANNAECYSGGGTGDGAIYVIDAKETDVQIAADVHFDLNQIGAGLVARVQDTDNHWLLAVKNPDATDPVLGLYKVASGTHTTVDSVTLTGFGPFGNGQYLYLRLAFTGNDILGEISLSDASVDEAAYTRYTVETTDAAYNTETDMGIWAADPGPVFKNWATYQWPVGFNAIVYDTTGITSSHTGTGAVTNNVYFYEGSNGQTADPYHSTVGYWSGGGTAYADVIDWRLTTFSTGSFVAKVTAVSGDTSDVTVREYGTTVKSFDTWIDLYRLDVALVAPVSTTRSAVVDITVGIDDGTTNPMTSPNTVTKRYTLTAISTGP